MFKNSDNRMLHVVQRMAGLTQLLNVDTPLSALERADTGVYRAKDLGRNQLVVEATNTAASIHSGEIELF